MIKVKAKTPVRYKGERYGIEKELIIDEKDMNKQVFELIEEIKEEEDGLEENSKENDDINETNDNPNKELELSELKVEELKELAKEKNIKGYSKMKKDELIAALAGN